MTKRVLRLLGMTNVQLVAQIIFGAMFVGIGLLFWHGSVSLFVVGTLVAFLRLDVFKKQKV